MWQVRTCFSIHHPVHPSSKLHYCCRGPGLDTSEDAKSTCVSLWCQRRGQLAYICCTELILPPHLDQTNFISCFFVSSWEKHQTPSNKGGSCNTPAHDSSHLSKSSNTKEDCHNQEEPRRCDDRKECRVSDRSWNRKKALGSKLRKSEKNRTFINNNIF